MGVLGCLMKYEVRTAAQFDAWFDTLDNSLSRRIYDVIVRMRQGNLGDYRTLRNAPGIYERRLTFGGGIRMYFAWSGPTLIILLGGGNKSSQRRDIEMAKATQQDIMQTD